MNVAQAVVAGVAAAEFELGLAGHHVQLIVHDHDFLGLDLEKARQRAHRFARQVHEGLRLQQPDSLALQRGARHQAVVAAVACQIDLQLARLVQHLADSAVVARGGVQDVVDLVDYAYGDATTAWGSVRINNDSHPQPYKLTGVELGNEQANDAWTDQIQAMEARAAAIADGSAREQIWLLEHPPLYTAGVSAKAGDLLDAGRFPVFQSGRGGQFTYHGPGQRVAYVMLDLTKRRRDVRAFVAALEAWVIGALGRFNVVGQVRPGRVGVWVERRTPGAPA